MTAQAFGQAQMFAERTQFCMRRLQVYNWGTFDGMHDVPMAGKGFLFVGRSGSGKTTLLDAFSALLVPLKWVNFNAAAQETDRRRRDRNLASYVRGAWAEQQDGGSGEVATQFLRKGSTWSALALTYHGTDGRDVVLVQLLWLRGNSSSPGDVRRHFMIFERPFDIQELEDFDLDVRRLKQRFGDAFHAKDFNPYCERFRRLLDIDSDMALRLLHKTQSAKNLGDLNTFLREFMLDRPKTFDVAERLVAEFGELNEAHQAVVTARDQVQTLQPARKEHERLQALAVDRAALDHLLQGVDAYRDMRCIALLEARLADLRVQADGLDGAIRQCQDTVEQHRQTLRDLEALHRQLGGDQIERLEAEKGSLETRHAERLRKRGQAQDACKALGRALPDTPAAFAEATGEARRELEASHARSEQLRQEQLDLATKKKEVEKEFAATVKEVEALRRQPSNIPAHMLELRQSVRAALGLGEDALPFVGELIEVKQQDAPWRGAIERVLHGFAFSLLVEERHYAALSNHLNAVHLGARLVYYQTGWSAQVTGRTPGMDSLFHKLEIKACEHTAWLEAELRQRFDYACVSSMRAFRQLERALTMEGQVRHGRTRHEKDDRHDVRDPRHWVLGFDNRDKRQLYEKQAQDQAEQISQLTEAINALTKQEEERYARSMHCQTLANLQWQEVDVAPLADRMREVDEQLARIRGGNKELEASGRRLDETRGLLDGAENDLRNRRVEAREVEKETEKFAAQLAALRDSADTALSPEQREGLDKRFAARRAHVTLENLDQQAQLVERELNGDLRAIDTERNRLEKTVENRFAEFKRRWPMEAGDQDATLASAPDFLNKLTRLEMDGLPAYEKRFFDLLQSQSHQNLASLSTHLRQARNEIRERMDLVNQSLGGAEFNSGTYLRIEVLDHQTGEVRDFRTEVQQALSHAWTDDRELSERRFVILRRLVERLGSQEPEHRRWRDAVLDVRQHVEFIGRELDLEDREVEVYRSGAGKSGGQRQKLATTCLAAALRYQLSGSDHEIPTYAPVVLDEAFDKADNEFTALAMNIFANFGFQMIVATPLKSVMTLEPFIGGACFIDISDRKKSGVLLIEYDEDRKRLKLPEQAHGDTAPAVT